MPHAILRATRPKLRHGALAGNRVLERLQHDTVALGELDEQVNLRERG